jgi:hypothetical protein
MGGAFGTFVWEDLGGGRTLVRPTRRWNDIINIAF